MPGCAAVEGVRREAVYVLAVLVHRELADVDVGDAARVGGALGHLAVEARGHGDFGAGDRWVAHEAAVLLDALGDVHHHEAHLPRLYDVDDHVLGLPARYLVGKGVVVLGVGRTRREDAAPGEHGQAGDHSGGKLHERAARYVGHGRSLLEGISGSALLYMVRQGWTFRLVTRWIERRERQLAGVTVLSVRIRCHFQEVQCAMDATLHDRRTASQVFFQKLAVAHLRLAVADARAYSPSRNAPLWRSQRPS